MVDTTRKHLLPPRCDSWVTDNYDYDNYQFNVFVHEFNYNGTVNKRYESHE